MGEPKEMESRESKVMGKLGKRYIYCISALIG